MFVLPGGRAAVDVAFTGEAFVEVEQCSLSVGVDV
jgi:hypothetical protein